MRKPVDAFSDASRSDRDRLIEAIKACLDGAAKSGIRSSGGRLGPAVGIQKEKLLGRKVSQTITHFFLDRNRLTNNAFIKLLQQLETAPWDTYHIDIDRLKKAYEKYKAVAESVGPTRYYNTPPALKSFHRLLEEDGRTQKQLSDADIFGEFIRKHVSATHSNGNSIEAIEFANIIGIGLSNCLGTRQINEALYAEYMSYLLLNQSIAAFRVEEFRTIAFAVRQIEQLVKLRESKMTVVAKNLILNHQELLNHNGNSRTSLTPGIHYAGIAYDAYMSSINSGLLELMPYEPGLTGNAALEYQLQGVPMEAKPDRFGHMTLEEVLVGDVEKSINAGNGEGAARLLFGLARGFMGTDLSKAIGYLDRGFRALGKAGKFHRTAEAKGLVLDARILEKSDGASAMGRIEYKLLQAREIYSKVNATKKVSYVDLLLKGQPR
jgi:hypothetical protein